MKIKLSDLTATEQVIANLQTAPEKTVKQSYWIDRIVASIESDLSIYRKNILALQKKYAEVDENGELVTKEGEQLNFKEEKDKLGFFKEYAELLEQEADIAFSPISIEIFSDLKLAGSTYGLRFFFKDDSETVAKDV